MAQSNVEEQRTHTVDRAKWRKVAENVKGLTAQDGDIFMCYITFLWTDDLLTI